MRTALAVVAIIVLALGWTSEAVHVEENGLTFSLEAVKRLKELSMSTAGSSVGQQSPRLRGAGLVSQCSDPMLPQEFVPLCKQRSAAASFARLVAVPTDLCEICAFAACGGC